MTMYRILINMRSLVRLYRIFLEIFMKIVKRHIHTYIQTDWLTDWWTDWLMDWLTDGLTDWLTDRLIWGQTRVAVLKLLGHDLSLATVLLKKMCMSLKSNYVYLYRLLNVWNSRYLIPQKKTIGLFLGVWQLYLR